MIQLRKAKKTVNDVNDRPQQRKDTANHGAGECHVSNCFAHEYPFADSKWGCNRIFPGAVDRALGEIG